MTSLFYIHSYFIQILPGTLDLFIFGGHCDVDGVASEAPSSRLSRNLLLLSLSSAEITGGQWGLENFILLRSCLEASALQTRIVVSPTCEDSFLRSFSLRSWSLLERTGGQLGFLAILNLNYCRYCFLHTNW